MRVVQAARVRRHPPRHVRLFRVCPVSDYGYLMALREQALRTRVMVLEDAIRQFVRGNETIAQLAMALDDRQGEWHE
jgi:hypothetical protein